MLCSGDMDGRDDELDEAGTILTGCDARNGGDGGGGGDGDGGDKQVVGGDENDSDDDGDDVSLHLPSTSHFSLLLSSSFPPLLSPLPPSFPSTPPFVTPEQVSVSLVLFIYFL